MLLVAFAGAVLAGYFVVPEVLVRAGRLLVGEIEPSSADAIVVLAGGGPERSREAADLYRSGLAPRVVLTSQELPDSYAEVERLGIDLVPPRENDRRILTGLGVPDSAMIDLDINATETLDELTQVRAFAEAEGWTALIIVTSNYHTRRVRLIVRHVFDENWDVGVVASRYSDFPPDGWWREARHARTFFVEFQKLLVYQVYVRLR